MPDPLSIEYVPTDDLIHYARNSRTHSEAQVAQIAASIREFGFTNPVLIDERRTIIAGHGRVLADALEFNYEPFDVAVAFLVLMFMPPARRREWLRELCKRVRPGGAIVVVDKTEGPAGYLSTIMHRLTIAGKVSSGVPSASIVEKELSLSGVQRPLSPGFISCAVPAAVEIFRFGEFAGWVIARPE